MTEFKKLTPEDFGIECWCKRECECAPFNEEDATEQANAKIAPLLARLSELEAVLANASIIYQSWGAHGEFWIEDSRFARKGTQKAELVNIVTIKETE